MIPGTHAWLYRCTYCNALCACGGGLDRDEGGGHAPQSAMCNPSARREMELLCEFQTHHQAFDHLSRLPDGTTLLLQEWGLLLVRQRAAGWVHILNSQMLAKPAEVEGSGTLNHQFFFQLLDAEKLLHLNLEPFYEVLRPLAELLPELCHDERRR